MSENITLTEIFNILDSFAYNAIETVSKDYGCVMFFSWLSVQCLGKSLIIIASNSTELNNCMDVAFVIHPKTTFPLLSNGKDMRTGCTVLFLHL